MATKRCIYVGITVIFVVFLMIHVPTSNNDDTQDNFSKTTRMLFVTDLVVNEPKPLVSLASFAQQINDQLHLSTYPLNIRSAALIRARDATYCPTTKTGILIVDFCMEEEQFVNVKSQLQSVLLSTPLVLMIEFDNGTSHAIKSLFCAFMQEPPSCTNGQRNEDETDVDCGGTVCARRCHLNRTCVTNTDCINSNCHSFLKTCQIPSCTDGNKNQDEIDIDCGGATCSTLCAPARMFH